MQGCPTRLPHRLRAPDFEIVEAAVLAHAAQFHLRLRRVDDAGVHTAELRRPQSPEFKRYSLRSSNLSRCDFGPGDGEGKDGLRNTRNTRNESFHTADLKSKAVCLIRLPDFSVYSAYSVGPPSPDLKAHLRALQRAVLHRKRRHHDGPALVLAQLRPLKVIGKEQLLLLRRRLCGDWGQLRRIRSEGGGGEVDPVLRPG